MSVFDVDTLQDKDLNGLIKALKGQLGKVRIGILGDKNMRDAQESEAGKEAKEKLPDLSKPIKVNAAKGIKQKAGDTSKLEVTTNAAVGVLHEFGTTEIPMRSFLRVPIADNLQKYLDKNGAFDKSAIEDIIKQRSIAGWLINVGITAEEIVADAFSSGGFGKWAPHADGYENNGGQILVDTQQLRNSITSDVK